jgi:hypothetical protein
MMLNSCGAVGSRVGGALLLIVFNGWWTESVDVVICSHYALRRSGSVLV